jgi:hypothetical protein
MLIRWRWSFLGAPLPDGLSPIIAIVITCEYEQIANGRECGIMLKPMFIRAVHTLDAVNVSGRAAARPSAGLSNWMIVRMGIEGA